MEYLTELEWIGNFHEFDEDEQKILLALSHPKYRWRTKDRLSYLSGLESTDLDKRMSKLIKTNVVRPSFNRAREVIFGLIERV